MIDFKSRHVFWWKWIYDCFGRIPKNTKRLAKWWGNKCKNLRYILQNSQIQKSKWTLSKSKKF